MMPQIDDDTVWEDREDEPPTEGSGSEVWNTVKVVLCTALWLAATCYVVYTMQGK